MPIIGYIHICLKPGWKKSFDMLINSIKTSNLYDNIEKIRCGLLTDDGDFVDDERFRDPKISVIYVGKSDEYERPTLLHMKKCAESDPEETKYFYLHTKGLRHFGTENESFVIEWINTLLYWNIERWEFAIEKLKDHDTYGCYYSNNRHYSGNFWWATSHHIKKLPSTIEESYLAPEDWVLTINESVYCSQEYTKEWCREMMIIYK